MAANEKYLTKSAITEEGYKLPTTSEWGAVSNGAAAGATAYQKPENGIPARDIAPGVIPDVSGFITEDECPFVEGNGTDSAVHWNNMALGNYSVAFGYGTVSSGASSHSEGSTTTSVGDNSHAEGYRTTAHGVNAHIEGRSQNKVSEATMAKANDALIADWNSSRFSLAKGNASHVEGYNNLTLANYAHAEGGATIALQTYSHSEGLSTKALASSSHAEGSNTTASGETSHAEGSGTTASGYSSHAEGHGTVASGNYSHAEGSSTTARGNYSHAEGSDTTALNVNEHAEGSFNMSNKVTSSYSSSGNTLHSVGIGTSSADTKNAFEIMQNGDAYLYGTGGYDGTNATASTTYTLQRQLPFIAEYGVTTLTEISIAYDKRNMLMCHCTNIGVYSTGVEPEDNTDILVPLVYHNALNEAFGFSSVLPAYKNDTRVIISIEIKCDDQGTWSTIVTEI